MYHYYLDLAGLPTLLQTPTEILISDRLSPFLRPPFDGEPACRITLQLCSALPEIGPGGLYHGLMCHERLGDVQRIFHCNTSHGEPFALTQLDPDGTVTLLVLEQYAHYFSGSSGIFNRIGMENLLLQHRGLLLHASFIKYHDTGILFTGPSGIGKSTQAALWQKYAGADIINGDRAALRCTHGQWLAWGSPYAGTSGIYRSDCAPVGALVVLRQAAENRLSPLTPAQAMRFIYPELSVHRWDREFVARCTDLFLDLAARVPLYLLECVPDESAVTLLKESLPL